MEFLLMQLAEGLADDPSKPFLLVVLATMWARFGKVEKRISLKLDNGISSKLEECTTKSDLALKRMGDLRDSLNGLKEDRKIFESEVRENMKTHGTKLDEVSERVARNEGRNENRSS